MADFHIELGEAYADLKNNKDALKSLLRAAQLYKSLFKVPYKKLAKVY
jgi:hypothetical protein